MVRGSESVCMILSRDDIENIADSLIKDFIEVTGINTIFTVIDQFATDYLGLKVTFEKLSNDDSFCGVTAYDDTNFKVMVDGDIRVIKIKKNQIILDSDFIEIGKVRERCGKRRFTLAHEVAHQILFQMPRTSIKMFMVSFEEAVKAMFPPNFHDMSLYSEHIVDKFCDYFHVSKSSAVITLKQLGYIAKEQKEKVVSYG